MMEQSRVTMSRLINNRNGIEGAVKRRRVQKLYYCLWLLIPFIPVLVGVILKLALIDKVPTTPGERKIFIVETYLTSLWLEFLVAAYILPIGLFIRGISIKPALRVLMYISPAIAFIICSLFFLAVPKFGITSIWLVIGIPTFTGALALILMGYVVHSQ